MGAFFASCGNDSSEDTNTESSSVVTSANNLDATTPTDNNPATATDASNMQAAAITPNAEIPAQPAANSKNENVKLNPPHGQPGHVCGIDVGAPLNGATASTANPQQNIQMQQAPQAQQMQPAQGVATPAPGTNPPHGQPGHVCGIDVGAPLK